MDLSTPVAALTRRIRLGLGEIEADLLLADTRLVNVLSGEIHRADIAIADGLVIGFGDYRAKKVLDCGGRFACPGLIDGHIHIESTLLTPWEFARAAAPRGTCAVVWDPHEIANVLGLEGVRYFLESAGAVAMDAARRAWATSDAASDTAKAAAIDSLTPTRLALQQSALRLVQRMCEARDAEQVSA